MCRKTQRPLEALLRFPVEWCSASVCFAATLVLLLGNPLFCLLRPINSIAALLVSSLGIKRFFEGFKVVSYQYHLHPLPRYVLSSKQIPFSQQQLFLGKGFRWQPKHTQRLWDCQQQPEYTIKRYQKQ